VGADDLRHIRASLRALNQNIADAGRTQRRLRRGMRVLEQRIEAFALEVSKEARRAPEEAPPDGWPQDPAAFGAAVRRARQTAGLARRRLAALVGLGETTIDNIEKGMPCRASTRQLIVQTFAQKVEPRDRGGR
jgi:ribosome-binding protein aMBF1 (putative translation factor)